MYIRSNVVEKLMPLRCIISVLSYSDQVMRYDPGVKQNKKFGIGRA